MIPIIDLSSFSVANNKFLEVPAVSPLFYYLAFMSCGGLDLFGWYISKKLCEYSIFDKLILYNTMLFVEFYGETYKKKQTIFFKRPILGGGILLFHFCLKWNAIRLIIFQSQWCSTSNYWQDLYALQNSLSLCKSLQFTQKTRTHSVMCMN